MESRLASLSLKNFFLHRALLLSPCKIQVHSLPFFQPLSEMEMSPRVTVEKKKRGLTFFRRNFNAKGGFFNCSSLAGNYQFLYEQTLRAYSEKERDSPQPSVSPLSSSFFCSARVINATFIVVGSVGRKYRSGIKKLGLHCSCFQDAQEKRHPVILN